MAEICVKNGIIPRYLEKKPMEFRASVTPRTFLFS